MSEIINFKPNPATSFFGLKDGKGLVAINKIAYHQALEKQAKEVNCIYLQTGIEKGNTVYYFSDNYENVVDMDNLVPTIIGINGEDFANSMK